MENEIFLQWEYHEKKSDKIAHRYNAKISYGQEEDHLLINTQIVGLILQSGKGVKRLSLYELEEFLDYHYYKYNGDKLNFFRFVRSALEEKKIHLDTEKTRTDLPDLINYVREEYYQRLLTVIEKSKEWIETKKLELSGKVEEQKTKGLTTKQQLLVLHYLGLLGGNLGLGSQNNLIEFLSKFFGLHNDTVKDGVLNKFAKSKTKENLDIVRDLFDEFGLSTEKIVRDIDEIEKKEKFK